MYDQGEYEFLAADAQIDCQSAEYSLMVAFATIMIVVYPIALPLLLFVALWRHRRKLNPTLDGHIESDVIQHRRDDTALFEEEPLAQFAMLYRPRYWWWGKCETSQLIRTTLMRRFISSRRTSRTNGTIHVL